MQTFLPYDSFYNSLECLDKKRLGKQRSEAKIMVKSIQGWYSTDAWLKHPCTQMWKDHVEWLMMYHDFAIKEWERRGFRNNMKAYLEFPDYEPPSWMGDERLHSSHRAALLYKDYDYYSQFGWKEEPKLDYWWPVK